jgi:hypothetical protein
VTSQESRGDADVAPILPEPASKEAGDGGVGARVSVKSLTIALLPFVVLGLLTYFQVPYCPARGLFGVPCPGCGLTRASFAMFQGDIHEMAHFNPLAPILFPLFVYGMVRVALVTSGVLPKSIKEPLNRVPSWVWTLVVIVVLGVYVLRLFGFLGGTADPVDFTQGLLYRGADAVIGSLFPD